MLGAQFHVRTVATVIFRDVTESQCISSHPNSLSYSNSYYPHPSSYRLTGSQQSRRRRRGGGGGGSKWISICFSSINFNGKSAADDDDVHDSDDDYVEAFVLIPETLSHYRMRTQGYQQEIQWRSPGQLYPFSGKRNDPRDNINAAGPGMLRRYPNPTIFLKISCDGDYLLPIIVGEFAVEKLISCSEENDSGDCPNTFQLTRNIIQRLGYKVKMVRVTERSNTVYFSQIYFHKPGKIDILRVDARPSDAINVAERCRAPIYINKQIVLTDAVRISYGMSSLHNTKSIYDVTLDSASDGRDLLAEELEMVKSMDLAIKEERYSDAAMWRDRLLNLREPGHNR